LFRLGETERHWVQFDSTDRVRQMEANRESSEFEDETTAARAVTTESRTTRVIIRSRPRTIDKALLLGIDECRRDADERPMIIAFDNDRLVFERSTGICSD